MTTTTEACVHHWMFGQTVHDGRDMATGVCKKCGDTIEECNHFSMPVTLYAIAQRGKLERKHMILNASM